MARERAPHHEPGGIAAIAAMQPAPHRNPLRPEPHGAPPSRPRPRRPLRLAPRALGRWALPPPHRGHRHHPLPPRIPRRHPRGPRRLGLDWDGEVRVQSAHFSDYRAALDALSARALLYPCFCTRADIARAAAAPHATGPRPEGPVYPGTCRRLAAPARAALIASGRPYALRLDMAAALALVPPLSFIEHGTRIPADPAPFGDVVLGRKETPASYHLAVTHDDAAQGVTLVTRGADLLPATAIHRLLQSLFAWPEPAYAHHPLLTDPSGRRLAKRAGAPTLRGLRTAGHTPSAVRAMAGMPD